MNKEENIVTYPNNIDTRVALLEMSIININETLKEIKSELKEMRTEIKEIRTEIKTETWRLIGVIAVLAGVMAHGFHWF